MRALGEKVDQHCVHGKDWKKKKILSGVSIEKLRSNVCGLILLKLRLIFLKTNKVGSQLISTVNLNLKNSALELRKHLDEHFTKIVFFKRKNPSISAIKHHNSLLLIYFG